MSGSGQVWQERASGERCFGLKGPRALEALKLLQLHVPAGPNTYGPLRASEPERPWNLIARLGAAEFFIAEQGAAAGIAALETLFSQGFDGAYPVLREDAGMVMGGARAPEVLAQVCNVNLAALDNTARPAVMTLMIGVGVLVLPQHSRDDGPIYRIWCDPSFGEYLSTELEQLIQAINSGRAP